jgi:hypothetical protein
LDRSVVAANSSTLPIVSAFSPSSSLFSLSTSSPTLSSPSHTTRGCSHIGNWRCSKHERSSRSLPRGSHCHGPSLCLTNLLPSRVLSETRFPHAAAPDLISALYTSFLFSPNNRVIVSLSFKPPSSPQLQSLPPRARLSQIAPLPTHASAPKALLNLGFFLPLHRAPSRLPTPHYCCQTTVRAVHSLGSSHQCHQIGPLLARHQISAYQSHFSCTSQLEIVTDGGRFADYEASAQAACPYGC